MERFREEDNNNISIAPYPTAQVSDILRHNNCGPWTSAVLYVLIVETESQMYRSPISIGKVHVCLIWSDLDLDRQIVVRHANALL